ncbi:MAG: DUF4175 family protein [Planctomycetota bacterium]|nr:DUF4175 family protein [Planctomycetota bacterium]
MDNHNIELVNSFLDAVRKRLRKREVTAAVSYLLTFAILALFAGVLGDHFFGLPATVRYIYFGLLLLSTAGFILFGIVRPLLRRFSRRYAAKLAENAFEELNGNLLAFSELESTTGPIAGALAERSLQGIERLSMTDIIPYRRIYQNTLLLCTLLFVFSAYTILSEKSTFDSLYRILMPSSAIAAPTSTALRSVSPGNYTVLEGEDVVFRVELSGVLPAEVLIRRTSGGKEVETELDQTSSGVYEGIVPAVVSGFEYSVVAGDASAGPFTIDVHPVPSINSVSFEVTPPAYSEREKWFSTDRSFDVLEGSTVRATILTSTDIRSATFLRLGKKTEMERTADRSATFEFKPRNDSSLFIRYRDTAGFESAFTAQYRIVVLPDKPPVVELLTPADGLQHPINSTLVLTGKVADDVGLRSQ